MNTLNEAELLSLCILSSIALFWGLYQVFPLLMRQYALVKARKRLRTLKKRREEIHKQWDMR